MLRNRPPKHHHSSPQRLLVFWHKTVNACPPDCFTCLDFFSRSLQAVGHWGGDNSGGWDRRLKEYSCCHSNITSVHEFICGKSQKDKPLFDLRLIFPCPKQNRNFFANLLCWRKTSEHNGERNRCNVGRDETPPGSHGDSLYHHHSSPTLVTVTNRHSEVPSWKHPNGGHGKTPLWLEEQLPCHPRGIPTRCLTIKRGVWWWQWRLVLQNRGHLVVTEKALLWGWGTLPRESISKSHTGQNVLQPPK